MQNAGLPDKFKTDHADGDGKQKLPEHKGRPEQKAVAEYTGNTEIGTVEDESQHEAEDSGRYDQLQIRRHPVVPMVKEGLMLPWELIGQYEKKSRIKVAQEPVRPSLLIGSATPAVMGGACVSAP
ncbi:MAG: hypothetical protein Tsb0017_14890 [Geothermobacteraceae bacterium]